MSGESLTRNQDTIVRGSPKGIFCFFSQETMERTRNQVRIKGANIMILLTILGCCYAVYSGKKAAERGESVEKTNLDWHAKYNESKTK